MAIDSGSGRRTPSPPRPRARSARRRREWFDDDSFWRDLYPFLFPASRFAAAHVDADKVLRLCRPKGKAVLDLCCGPGRFSIALAKRRFAVTGVDRTKFLLDKARAGARAAKVKVEWVQRDMRDFVRPASFDLALSMFTSFGYFDDKREDIRVLENVLASLTPGGVCLIEVGGKEWLARIFSPTTSHAMPDGSTLVQRHTIFDDWTRIRNEWTLIRRGRAKTFTFHHTVYSGQELRDRMERVGFERVRLFGTLDGDEYGSNASRLIALGRKPKRP
ncbi:MAG TPA: methyltransferase domain-containing protein [Candidatus Eisenbacteria bacterium]